MTQCRLTGCWQRLRCALVALCLVALAPGLAMAATVTDLALRIQVQQLDTTRYPRITSYFTVTREGEPIAGLTAREVSLFVDDQELEVFTLRSVTEEGARISVVLALDTSGSMRGAPLAAAQESGVEFVGRLAEGDRASVITFGGAAKSACGFTTDRERVTEILRSATARGDTSLYDGVLLGLDRLAEEDSPRKALLVLTDGKDTESRASEARCLEDARAAGVPVFAIGLGREVDRAVIAALADASGGEAYFAAGAAELLGIYQRIAERLTSQYVLSYESPAAEPDAGPWRELMVEVSYGGQTARAERRYLDVRDGPGDGPAPGGPSLLMIAIVLVAAFDLLLLLGVLVRRRRVSGKA